MGQVLEGLEHYAQPLGTAMWAGPDLIDLRVGKTVGLEVGGRVEAVLPNPRTGPWLWHWRKTEEDRFSIDFADTKDFCLEGRVARAPSETEKVAKGPPNPVEVLTLSPAGRGSYGRFEGGHGPHGSPIFRHLCPHMVLLARSGV